MLPAGCRQRLAGGLRSPDHLCLTEQPQERSLVRNIRLHTLSLKSGLVIAGVLFAACNRTAPTVSGPLPQRGYLWQRDWTATVNGAVLEAQKRMDGVVLLGAEISWTAGKPEVFRPNINWETLKSHDISCGIAL